MIDLLNIAKTEANGNLFNELSNIFEKADIKPEGYPDAVVWHCLLYTSPSPRDS